MSGIKIDPRRESKIIINPTSDTNLQKQLLLWKHLASSCYGPFGKSVSVQNVIGGQVSITKSSYRLLELIRPSHPMTQLVVSAIKNHMKHYRDFGLFAMTLTFELLDAYEKTNLSQSAASIANEYFAKIILTHLLDAENSCCCLKLDLTSVHQLMPVVKCIFKSKLFILTDDEICFLSSLSLESFLSLLPCDLNQSGVFKLGNLHTICQEGVSMKHSKFVSGFLYSLPISQTSWRDYNLLDCKIVLFKVSLAGDLSLTDLTIEVNQSHAVKDCVLKMLFDLVEKLIDLRVKIVACQKVVHPKICKLLENQNVIVLQRLGENGCQEISKLTNSVPIGSLNAENINENDFGIVGKTEFMSLFGRNYVRFFGSSGTIVLCHNNEENLNELSALFQQSFRSLLLLLHNPKTVIGGSCLEFHLASIVTDEVNHAIRSENRVQSLGISAGQLTEAVNTFSTVLKRMGLNLLKNKDVTSAERECCCKCCGNLKIEENSLLDVAASKLSAYKTAMEAVSIILKIGICIIDKT